MKAKPLPPKGWEYACPTEAEWEYACRAAPPPLSTGDDTRLLARYANFADKTLRDHDPGYYCLRLTQTGSPSPSPPWLLPPNA